MISAKFITNLTNKILTNKNLGKVKLVNVEEENIAPSGRHFVRKVNLVFYFETKLLSLIFLPNPSGLISLVPNVFYSLIGSHDKFSNLMSSLFLPLCHVWQNEKKIIALTKELHDLLLSASQGIGLIKSKESFHLAREKEKEKLFWTGNVVFFFEAKDKEGKKIFFNWALSLRPRCQESLFGLLKSKIYLKDGGYPSELRLSISEPLIQPRDQ